jgi:hypothetical protein
MLQDPKVVVSIWTDALTKATTRMVSASLMGRELERVPVQVTIEIPEPLHDAIVEASEATGTDPKAILAKMASEGFQKSIDEKLMLGRTPVQPIDTGTSNINCNAANPSQMFSQLKAAGLDMGQLDGKMGKLNEMMEMLNNMKEYMDHAADTFGINEPEGKGPKDPE